MHNNAIGKNDILTSNDGNNWLYGDAPEMFDTSTSHNDNLISGLGTDTMYGDAATNAGTAGGADLFIVGGNTNAEIKNYSAEDGDRIAGSVTKDYLSISSSNSGGNEQQQIQGQLNALLLKGKTK